MDFLTLAEKRYSVRSFDPRPVEEEKLRAVLEAARLAPTAINLQPQRIYVLKSEAAREKMASLCPYTFQAPVLLLVCADEERAWHSPIEPGYSSGEADAAIAATHMMLAAAEQGLGTTWVRGFHAGRVQRAFDLPAHIRPVCLLPLGYPGEKARPSRLHTASRELGEMVEEW